MTFAEIHGKPQSRESEDLLTSEVFQSLKNINREFGLKKFLKILRIGATKKELEDAQFEFWKTFKDKDNTRLNTELDVVIELKKKLIFIECKYRSGFHKNQLKKEYYQGIKNSNGRDFYLICLTANYSEPEEVKKTRESLGKDKDIKRVLGNKQFDRSTIKWTSWQQIREIFKEIYGSENSEIDKPSKRIAEDINELLKHKGLRGYMGFGVTESDLEKAVETVEKITQEFQALINEIVPRLEKKGIIKDTERSEDRIERDGTNRGLNTHYDRWITYYYAYPFVSAEADKNLKDAFLFINLDLSEPSLNVGCALKVNRKASKKILRSKNKFYNNFFLGNNWNYKETDLLQDMESDYNVEVEVWGEDYLTLGTSFGIEDLGDRESIKKITGEFVRYKKLIPKVAKGLAD